MSTEGSQHILYHFIHLRRLHSDFVLSHTENRRFYEKSNAVNISDGGVFLELEYSEARAGVGMSLCLKTLS